MRKNSQVVTYSHICIGQIKHKNHDVSMVEVMMTEQFFFKNSRNRNI